MSVRYTYVCDAEKCSAEATGENGRPDGWIEASIDERGRVRYMHVCSSACLVSFFVDGAKPIEVRR